MVTKSWKLGAEKNGVLWVIYLDKFGTARKVSPSSENVKVTDIGIEFEARHGKGALNVQCLFEDIAIKKRPPLPVAKRLELGTFDDAAVRQLRSHILGFVYEFVAGVCFERNPAIVRKTPFSFESLLAEYPQFASQLNAVDWGIVRGVCYGRD